MPIPDEIERVCLLGWKVFPSSRSSRAGMFRGAHLAATDNLNVIAGWCRDFPACNWRVAFGRSFVWGLDIDAAGETHANDGIGAMRELVAVHGSLPPKPAIRTGGGGYAIFFAHNGERIIGEGGHPAPGIDPRRGAQSQTIPPSIHVDTRRPYYWIDPPWKVAPPVAPVWLTKLLEPAPEIQWSRVAIDTTDQARARLYRAAMAVMDAPPGSRNETLNRRSHQIGRLIGAGQLSEQEAIEALYGAARQAGLDHLEIKATIRSGVSAGRRAARG